MWKYWLTKIMITLAVGVWTIAFIKTGMRFDDGLRTVFTTIGVFPAIYFAGEYLDLTLKNKFKNKE